MGTRAIAAVKNSDGKKIIELYTQYDGYPDGYGKDIADFISSGVLVNGYGSKGLVDGKRQFNGVECFAAQLVDELKDGVGGKYLLSPDNDAKPEDYSNKWGAEYYYEIDSKLSLKCFDSYSGDEIVMSMGVASK